MTEPTTYPLVTIQPAMQPDMSMPYPYHVQPDGTIARQDFWKGDPAQLAGFQRYPETQTVDLECEDFLAKPEQAIGMYPVFITGTGDMFTLTTPIEAVHRRAAAHE